MDSLAITDHGVMYGVIEFYEAARQAGINGATLHYYFPTKEDLIQAVAEYTIERLYRDCRALDLIEGTGQLQRVVLAADLLRPYGVKIAA